MHVSNIWVSRGVCPTSAVVRGVAACVINDYVAVFKPKFIRVVRDVVLSRREAFVGRQFRAQTEWRLKIERHLRGGVRRR